MNFDDAYDLIVIGSGPAGESGAVTAAALGKRVVVIEKSPYLGGSSANTGTLPSKTLRETALAFAGLRARKLYGVDLSLKREATIAELMYHERHVKLNERERIQRNLSENDIELVRGQARFLGPNTISVLPSHEPESPTPPERILRGEVILIATGSSPVQPQEFPFEDHRVHDSDEILQLERLPRTLVVVGAGVIGSEYACTFAALGVKVTVVDGRNELLPFLDADMSAALERAMREHLGVTFLWGETVTGCTPSADSDGPVILTTQTGRRIEVDGVLVAAGRVSNTSELDLSAAGLCAGPRGKMEVDGAYRTSIPHIYAAGDVIGSPGLAATSKEQARIAMSCAFDSPFKCQMAPLLPTGIYTIPEVSMVGGSEEDLRAQGVDIVVGRALYAKNARGEIIGDRFGFLKLIFRRHDRRLLGVHVIGEIASEIVHVGLMAMLVNADIELLERACFNYPTLGDLYKDACYDALLRLVRGHSSDTTASTQS
jgi:NAD(P) transhydrogenase